MILIRRVVPPMYVCSVLERQLLISVTVTPVFRRFHFVVCSVAAVSSAEVVGIKPVMTNGVVLLLSVRRQLNFVMHMISIR